ncbi:ribonuclease T2 family protein [Blastochloris sulfoviridis]|uniref:Ribonuclease T2 n=1 Tax=Blastochloris sulfoviridis TaxID=50712 RepID=A0A5M6I1Y5_9HYPH|nr:ribonuclease T2 [Blastochloris sulfoviridis]KAA5602221.1 ribonuclease T2 [Blastochloris sulfoviridis]
MRLKATAAALSLAACLVTAPAPARADTPGTFDFYVLALSWSPTWCRQEGARREAEQCRSNRPYSFIVHGLWPQFERGYPANCVARPPRLDDRLVRSMLDLTPSFGLILHQWRKHGTCAGLEPAAFFDTVRRAHERVKIPSEFRDPDRPRQMAPVEVENAFVRDNAGLARDMIAVDCREGLLREVRICFSRDLAFRPCPEVDRRACRTGRIEVPPPRGG